MRTNSGKAIFASLAIHAGVVVAAVQFWTMPVREPGTGRESFGVCLFSPPPEAPPLIEIENDEIVVEEAVQETVESPSQPDSEIEPVSVEIPAVIDVQPEAEMETQPPEPPATQVPSHVVETQPPKAKPAPKTTAKAQPPSGKRANAPASGTKSKGAGAATIPPQLKSKSAPRYRETAEMRGKRLTVWLALEVDERGRVSAVRVKRGCGFEDLDNAAAAAARRYRFTPALTGGNAVPWTFDHAVTFAL